MLQQQEEKQRLLEEEKCALEHVGKLRAAQEAASAKQSLASLAFQLKLQTTVADKRKVHLLCYMCVGR